jgi:hypothetical protein
MEWLHDDRHNLYRNRRRLDPAIAISPSLAPVGRALFAGALFVQVIGDAR